MSYPSYPSGNEPPPGATYGYGAPGFQGPRANQLAMWSMISGITAFPLLCFCGIGLFAAIAALIMGIVSRRQIRGSQGLQSGDGQALAGIILGSVGIAFGLLYALFTFWDFVSTVVFDY